MTSRTVEVAPARIDVWLKGFGERHGQVDATREDTPGGVLIRAVAADGSTAFAVPFAHDPLVVVLLRRGGYALAIVDDTQVRDSKVGTRHVQGRTAAGGWSQQRFARRRANQTDELVGAVTEHLVRILGTAASMPPTALALGGDRALGRAVLEDPRLRWLADLPRREFPEVGDPKRPVLEEVVRRARAYRVELTEPPTPSK